MTRTFTLADYAQVVQFYSAPLACFVDALDIRVRRAVEEWFSVFDDPIRVNSALDRLANASYKIVIEGSCYRQKLSPHRKLLGHKEV